MGMPAGPVAPQAASGAGTNPGPAMLADLTMWATRAGVSAAARRSVAALAGELAAAGVRLRGFAAFDGTRPDDSPRDSAPAGSIINLDA